MKEAEIPKANDPINIFDIYRRKESEVDEAYFFFRSFSFMKEWRTLL
jgi:hypothetical protein